MLQIGRRILADGGELVKDAWQVTYSKGKNKITKYSMTGALRAAVDLAHPRDPHRALEYARHALQGALNRDEKAELGMAHLDYPVLTRFECHPDTTVLDALRVFDDAIKSQGSVNFAARKAKGRK